MNRPITVDQAKLIVCTQDSYLNKFDIFSSIEENGTFLLNTTHSKEEVIAMLPEKAKQILKTRNVKFYLVNASKVAKEHGLGNKI